MPSLECLGENPLERILTFALTKLGNPLYKGSSNEQAAIVTEQSAYAKTHFSSSSNCFVVERQRQFMASDVF